VDRNRVLFNRTHDNGKAGVGAGILLASGTGNEARGNHSWNNDIGIYVFGDSVNASVTDNWTWGNRDAEILVDRLATGTIRSGNSTGRPEP
jgi:nitrous oxidase accessory protein NosD